MRFHLPSLLKNRFPIFNWLPEYNLQKGICDLIAGITVGLTLIPQSIAYAGLAGLSPEYGLYSSLCGGIIYTIFGTVPDLNIAPTALLALLTYTYTHNSHYDPVASATLLCFLAGVIEIGCGLFHLGFLVDFVSTPVVVGFTSAGALTIAGAQLKNMFGLHFKAESLVKIIYKLIANVKDVKAWDAGLSVGCCVCLILLRQLKLIARPPAFEKKDNTKNDWRTALWFASVARNAFVVIFCTVLAYILTLNDMNKFTLTNPVPQGLPSLTLPFHHPNGTSELLAMTKNLGSGIGVVPMIAILSNIAIAKAFSSGKSLDASQEMLAVGICSVFGSFLGSFPVNASFSRAAVNNASGARTTFGGIYTGIMVILSLTFLTPYFAYIPKPTLAAVVICAVIYMVEVELTKVIWKVNKIDFFPLAVTFVACISLSIEIGIILGIFVDLLLTLYYVARPKIEIHSLKHDYNFFYIIVEIVGILSYTASEYTRDKIMKTYLKCGSSHKYVVFDMEKMHRLDFTAINVLGALAADLSKLNVKVVFLKCRNSAHNMLRKRVQSNNVHFAQTSKELDDYFEEKETSPLSPGVLNAGFQPDNNHAVDLKLQP